MKSVLGDEELALRLPWQDVIIDCCGPYTRAESGEQYCLVYICTQLKVPMLEPFVSLQSGHFSRAFVKCVLRTRVIPDVVRSDRGPEMVSQLNEEFLAICNARHKLGAALTPRHQGLCERNHQVMMSNQNVLMSEICKAHPQEWHVQAHCGVQPRGWVPQLDAVHHAERHHGGGGGVGVRARAGDAVAKVSVDAAEL